MHVKIIRTRVYILTKNHWLLRVSNSMLITTAESTRTLTVVLIIISLVSFN